MDDAKAKGEAIWLAKVIANRKLYGGAKGKKADTPAKSKEGKVQIWKSLSGIPQTDETYHHDIVERFGEEKYRSIEHAIEEVLDAGMDYKQIRDCEHATGGRNTGWCKVCSETFEEKLLSLIPTKNVV